MSRVTKPYGISLPVDLADEARIAAAADGRSLSSWIAQLIKRELSK